MPPLKKRTVHRWRRVLVEVGELATYSGPATSRWPRQGQWRQPDPQHLPRLRWARRVKTVYEVVGSV